MNKVLFVDDEINILNALRRGVIDEEYKAFFATSGQTALKILEKQKINVIVADMRMPGMDGIKLLKEVKSIDPDIVRIVLSGYAQLPQIIVAVNKVGVFKFILKPWDINELLEDIRAALEYYNLKSEAEKLKKNLRKTSKMYDMQLELLQDQTLLYKENLNNVSIASKKMIDTIKWIVKNEMGMAYIDHIGKIHRALINEFIFNKELFTTEQMMQEFHNYIKNYSQREHIKIGLNRHSEQQYRGNYKLILFTFNSILKDVVLEEGNIHQQIKILLDENKSDEQNANISTYLVINTDKEIERIMNHPVNYYLSMLIKPYGLDIVIQEEKNGVSIHLSMRAEKV